MNAAGDGSVFAPVYRVLRDAIAQRAFPGCAFGVLAGGQIVLADALGSFTYDDGAPPVTAQTVFDIASITKVVATTAAAMLLSQRGQLDVDAPLGEFLPGFVVGRARGDKARKVTLRHLLAHNSGLPGYSPLYKTCTTPALLFRATLQMPLVTDPGTHAEYSDHGFMLLGKALEVVTHEYLADWTAREVFAPLGMSNTRFCPARWQRESIPPTEEDTTLRMRRIQGEVQDEHAWLLHGAGGHAGLFSNVLDLLGFAQAILVGAPGSGESIFHAGTIVQFSERQMPAGSSRALGWDTPSDGSSAGTHFSAHSIGHLGFSGCSLWIDLDTTVAVVLLTNRTWPDRQNQLIRTVRPAFHNAIREVLHGMT
jgi:serine-type D-Ala-D-Ala carboxypeptidase